MSPAPQAIHDLVERFERNREAYRSGQYNEMQVRHDQMVALVERMLELHRQLAAAKTPTAKELLGRQIAASDQQIDWLVYELYGLTEEEIEIVEGKGTGQGVGV